jgi:uncharacterized membrane protein
MSTDLLGFYLISGIIVILIFIFLLSLIYDKNDKQANLDEVV